MMEALNLSKKRKVAETIEETPALENLTEIQDLESRASNAQKLFISAIQSNSEKDLIECLPLLPNSIDLMFASLFCIMRDWKMALKVLVVIPMMKTPACLQSTYHMNEFYWKYFSEKSPGFFDMNTAQYLFIEALFQTMRLNKPELYEILLDGHLDDLLSKYDIGKHSRSILKYVSDHDGDVKATEKLQCAFFKPLMMFAMRSKRDFSDVFEIICSSVEAQNDTVTEMLLNIPEFMRKLQETDGACHDLSTLILYSGNKELAHRILKLEKKRCTVGVSALLEIAMKVDDLGIIESVMKIDAPIKAFNWFLNPYSLYEYMKERGKGQLFIESCPNVHVNEG